MTKTVTDDQTDRSLWDIAMQQLQEKDDELARLRAALEQIGTLDHWGEMTVEAALEGVAAFARNALGPAVEPSAS